MFANDKSLLALQAGKWRACLITLHNVFSADDREVFGVSASVAGFAIWPREKQRCRVRCHCCWKRCELWWDPLITYDWLRWVCLKVIYLHLYLKAWSKFVVVFFYRNRGSFMHFGIYSLPSKHFMQFHLGDPPHNIWNDLVLSFHSFSYNAACLICV